MTKTDFKAQGIDDLRAALLELYDDEDGSLAAANKTALLEFTDANWEYIDSVINPEEAPEEDAEPEAEDLPEEAAEEDDEVDLSKPNPKTDLYTGRIGG